MRFKLKEKINPEEWDTRIVSTFIIFKRIGLEIRILEFSKIRQQFIKYKKEDLWSTTPYTVTDWVDKEWAD